MRSVLVLAALTTLSACATDETSELWSTTTAPTISRSTDDTAAEDTGTEDTGTNDTGDSGDTGPTTESACADGMDDDADGAIDCDDTDCAADAACTPPAPESVCDDGTDDDSDGATDCDDPDCAADAACTTPSTETVCDDGLDEDGDGAMDCDDTDCAADPACIVSVACALADGPWTLSATYDADTCTLESSLSVNVACSGDGLFTLSVAEGALLPVAVTLECTTIGGTAFNCTAPPVPGVSVSVGGTSDGPVGTTASGTMSLTTSTCGASGSFTAAQDAG